MDFSGFIKRIPLFSKFYFALWIVLAALTNYKFLNPYFLILYMENVFIKL